MAGFKGDCSAFTINLRIGTYTLPICHDVTCPHLSLFLSGVIHLYTWEHTDQYITRRGKVRSGHSTGGEAVNSHSVLTSDIDSSSSVTVSSSSSFYAHR
jgi:hypothetical protein